MSGDLEEIGLNQLLGELAAEAGAAPHSVEQQLRLRCRALRLKRQRRQRTWMAMAVAACLLVMLGWRWMPVQPAKADRQTPNLVGFLALPYAQSGIPMEQAIVVRVNLQRTDLDAMGLPSTWRRGRSRMEADLLIGQDGVARAVRFADDAGR